MIVINRDGTRPVARTHLKHLKKSLKISSLNWVSLKKFQPIFQLLQQVVTMNDTFLMLPKQSLGKVHKDVKTFCWNCGSLASRECQVIIKVTLSTRLSFKADLKSAKTVCHQRRKSCLKRNSAKMGRIKELMKRARRH